MKSAEHICSFKARDYIKQRFCPMVVGFVDQNVDKIFNYCGVTFTDFFTAICSYYPDSIRFVNVANIIEVTENQLFDKIKNDTTNYGKAFIDERFEKTTTIDENIPQFEYKLPKKFTFGSENWKRPPWFQNMVQKVYDSNKYRRHSFVDMPVCLIYVCTVDSDPFDKKAIKSMMPLQTWMMEFMDELPVVRIMIYDGMAASKPPKVKKMDFDYDTTLTIRTKQLEENIPANTDFFNRMFSYNPELIQAMLNSNLIGVRDIEAVVGIIQSIQKEIITPYVSSSIIKFKEFIEKQGKTLNVIRGMFKKKADKTDPNTLPIKKICQLRLAAMYMMTMNMVEADKMFRHISLHMPNLKLRLIAKYYYSLIAFTQGTSSFTTIKELIDEVFETADLKLALAVILITSELFNAENDNKHCMYVLQVGISKFRAFAKNNDTKIFIILGFLYERLAGIIDNDKKILYYTAQAGDHYMNASQHGHALRCTIWLINILPRDSWPYLYQGALLNKAIALAYSNEVIRSILGCKELLEMDDLQEGLQEKTISQFWSPFNTRDFDPSQINFQFSPLISVKSATLVTPSMPEYWGYERSDFQEILDAFLQIKEDEEKMNSKTLTIESWMQDEEVKSVDQIIKVSTSCKLKVLVNLSNKYVFGVNLTVAQLEAEYHGQNPQLIIDNPYSTPPTQKVDVPSKRYSDNGVVKVLPLDFVCNAPGLFKINKFNMKNWGCVETSVTFPSLIIKATDEFPLLSMEVQNLPSEMFQGFCVRFNVSITNKGKAIISQLTLGFDHPNAIAYEGDVEFLHGIANVSINQTILPGETIQVPLIFRAAKINLNRVHFYLSQSQTIVAMAAISVKVGNSASIYARAVPISHDPSKFAIKVKFDPKIDGLSLVGVFDKSGRMLDMLNTETSKDVHKESSMTIVFFGDKYKQDSVLENWRLFMLEQSSYALLYKCSGYELLGQQNLRVQPEPGSDVRLDAPNFVNFEPATKIKVTATFSKPVFVQPKPVELVNDAKGEITLLMPCRWTGVTRKKVSEENGYKCDFTFTVMTPGVFQLTGFICSETKEFLKVDDIQMLHLIHVVAQ